MEISFKNKRVLVTGAGQVNHGQPSRVFRLITAHVPLKNETCEEAVMPQRHRLRYSVENVQYCELKGIGRGIAIELWRTGAKVVAVSRTKSHLESLQKEYPSIDIVELDVANWENTRKVIDSLGTFDALVNNAAMGTSQPFLECTREVLDAAVEVNLKSVINISQVVARKMVENKIKGSIVNISSQASKAALKDHTVYGATKAALDAVTRNMALELGPYGIRVNSVNPTVIMTAMGREGWSDPVKSEGMLSKIPLRRFGEVYEVVNAVLYLLSDKASMINGVELPIDGGFLAT